MCTNGDLPGRDQAPNHSLPLHQYLGAFPAHLVNELSALNTRIDSLMDRLPHASPDPEVDSLRQALALNETQLRVSLSKTEQLERSLKDLTSEIAHLRGQNAWLMAANQGLGERMVALMETGKSTEKALAAALEESDRLAEALRDRDRLLTLAQQQLDELYDEHDKEIEDDEALRAEVHDLREAKVRLTAALDSASRTLKAMQDHQRVMVECLLRQDNAQRLGELLVQAGLVTEAQVDQALADQAKGREHKVGQILMQNGHIEESEFFQALACHLRIPFVKLHPTLVSHDAARLTDSSTCSRFQCLPIRVAADGLVVAMADPNNREAVGVMQETSSTRLIPVVATPTDILAAIRTVFALDPSKIETPN